MQELTQDEIDQVYGGGFLSKFGKFLGFTAIGILGGQLGWWQWVPR
jgi:hypothetical protein